ncbi:MAG: MoxR family ATPase [Bacteroidota bacterium]
MKELNYKRYTGQALEERQKDKQQQHVKNFDLSSKIIQIDRKPKELDPYFPSQELRDAIEYARIIQRPLLLRGEPGCGKTRVAEALAYELYNERSNDSYQNHYFEWFIKSTTKAQEGLYQFDYLARLRDIQAKGSEEKPLTSYRKFGPLGKAFLTSKPDEPSILLIDEIDKASLDFPNDLLLELDEKRFVIEETGETIQAEYPPIVIITSNDEKELPSAFLRRCVFHYIDFPSEEDLLKIAIARFGQGEKVEKIHNALPKVLLEQAVRQFDKLYKSMKDAPNTDKPPSTSEFIDWLRVIQYFHLQENLPLEGDKLPESPILYPEVLLKSLDDYRNRMQS